MKKTAKKVNVKDITKAEIKKAINEMFANKYSLEEGKNYGFTKDSLVLHAENTDIQIKIIAPKTGVIRYEAVEED